MLSNIKRGWLMVASIVAVVVLLNPTYSDFKDFTGQQKADSYYTLQKEWNFLGFSIYSAYDNESQEKHEYLALLKNFIKIS